MTDSPAPREPQDTFVQIFLTACPKLRRTAFRLTGNWSEVDDLVQSTYVRAVRYADRICAVEAPEAYLKQILTRTCIDWRRKKSATEYITNSVPESAAVENPNDDKWAVRAALAAVPKSQREVLILRYYADLSVAETARALNCSTGNVKSQCSRGLAALARGLAAREAMPRSLSA